MKLCMTVEWVRLGVVTLAVLIFIFMKCIIARIHAVDINICYVNFVLFSKQFSDP